MTFRKKRLDARSASWNGYPGLRSQITQVIAANKKALVPHDVQQNGVNLIQTADQTHTLSHIGQLVPKVHSNYKAEYK